MAKKKARKISRTRSRKSLYRPGAYGIKYDSLTFILFLVFVLLVSWLLVAKII